MDPIVEGALIGAVPALLGGALATWAALRASRISLEQTELALAADHARWLRDKRSDIYVEMYKWVTNASMNRSRLIKDGPVTPDLAYQIATTLDAHISPAFENFGAGTDVLASSSAVAAFRRAANADKAVWQSIIGSKEKEIVLAGPLGRLTGIADTVATGLKAVIREDLESADMRVVRRPGRAPQS